VASESNSIAVWSLAYAAQQSFQSDHGARHCGEKAKPEGRDCARGAAAGALLPKKKKKRKLLKGSTNT
jgi:hypothetical protein